MLFLNISNPKKRVATLGTLKYSSDDNPRYNPRKPAEGIVVVICWTSNQWEYVTTRISASYWLVPRFAAQAPVDQGTYRHS